MRGGCRLGWWFLLLSIWCKGASSASFAYSLVDNAEADFAIRGWLMPDSAFRRNLEKVGRLWGARIASSATFSVRVRSDRTARRAGGTFSYGRQLGNAADGSPIWEPGPLSKVLTGNNPGERAYGYDIEIVLDPVFVDQYYWVNTDPETQSASVPSGRTDLIWVLLHEMGHALGIAGTWLPGTQSHGPFVSIFDSYLYFGGSGTVLDGNGRPNPAFFSGPETALAAGEPARIAHVGPSVPLYTQDFYHLGSCNDPVVYTMSLMNGCQTLTRPGEEITGPDLALLADIGYPINSVYYPSSGEVRTAVKLANARGVETMIAVILKVIDPVTLTLELKDIAISRRSASDATYDAVTGNVTMSALVLGETQYAVELELVSPNPARWKVGRIAVH